MESENSGSMQSSSGGEEEYNSRGESITSLLNPSGQFGWISGQPPPLVPNHQPSFLSPRLQNLGALPNPQSLANSSAYTQYGNDFVCSQGSRYQPNYEHLGNITSLPSSAGPLSERAVSSMNSSRYSLLEVQGSNQAQFASSSSIQSQVSIAESLSKDDTHKSINERSDQPSRAKNPKKRTRASRRAPTTVLATDTTSFRQMVQAFTGIPTAPFSGPPYSDSLDLFLGRSAHSVSLGSLYPSRPSTQKVNLSPFSTQDSSSAMLSSRLLGGFVSNKFTGGTTDNPSSTTNPDLGIMSKPSQNALNMQNYQVLDFQQPLTQSYLHPSPRSQPSNSGTRSQAGGTSVLSLEALGLSHENANTSLSGFQSRESADGVQLSNIQRWGYGETDGGDRTQHGAFDSKEVN